jgi:short-subunit dehydrogenase
MRRLTGKRALITGAGRGLGRDLSLALAAEGVEVIVTDIQQRGMMETVQMVQAAGGRAFGYVMDVTSVSDVEQVRDELHRQRGPLDILVNNAGIVIGGPFLDIDLHRHRMVLGVNTWGPMVVTHVFLPELIARPAAHLVTIASASGIIPVPLQVSYAASKWAALGFSDAIREELRLNRHKHVRVTSVCPSYLDTGMFGGTRLPRFTRAMSSAVVARKVVRAVKRNKNYLLTPWLVHLLPYGKVLFPLWLGQMLCDWMGVTNGMCGWVGYANDERTTITRAPRSPQTPTGVAPQKPPAF